MILAETTLVCFTATKQNCIPGSTKLFAYQSGDGSLLGFSHTSCRVSHCVGLRRRKCRSTAWLNLRPKCHGNGHGNGNDNENESESGVKVLELPQQWMHPSAALQESEWLRNALNKWLDAEYCPEPANVEISKRCAKVYYNCLLQKQSDVGEILMGMVRDLETFSFKQSFHGPFSAANAAVQLITMRLEAMEN